MCPVQRVSHQPTHTLLSHGCLAPHSECEFTNVMVTWFKPRHSPQWSPAQSVLLAAAERLLWCLNQNRAIYFPLAEAECVESRALTELSVCLPALCHHGAVVKGHSLRSCCQNLQTSHCSDLQAPILTTCCTCKSALLRLSQWRWFSNVQKGSTWKIFAMHSS